MTYMLSFNFIFVNKMMKMAENIRILTCNYLQNTFELWIE